MQFGVYEEEKAREGGVCSMVLNIGFIAVGTCGGVMVWRM